MITVVSGLSRSGTSLMMQFLQAGGLPLLHDQERQADTHNPRGYFEYSKMQGLESDNSWLGEAEGKAIKVLSPLLYHLPPQHEYCVIFMRRDLDEIIRSQHLMLTPDVEIDPTTLETQRGKFTQHLQDLEVWMAQQSNFRVRPCNFSDVVADPLRVATAVSRFLGIFLDTEHMAAAVDPTLYRQRV